MFDYSKLIGRIKEICGSQAAFAKKMGLSEHTISEKLAGKKMWTQSQIARACEILNIAFKDIPLYFFTPKVQ